MSEPVAAAPVRSLRALCTVATPLFCQGASPEDVAIRPASLRGVLRWWWRATRFPQLAIAAQAGAGGGTEALSTLAGEEAAIFGGAAGEHAGRSRLRLLVGSAEGLTPVPKGEVLRSAGQVVGPGCRYLGYGLMGAFGNKEGRLERGCLVPAEGQRFDLDLVGQGLDDRQWATVQEALEALGLLGGLGARSRRGWGSIAVQAVEGVDGWPDDTTAVSTPGPPGFDELVGRLRALVDRVPGGAPALPAITALSPAMRVVAVPFVGPPLRALEEVGAEMVRYRNWGHDGKILEKESPERNFRDDHDLMMKPSGQGTTHPRRVAFGLPHNYGPSRQVTPAEARLDRRASPLLIHIHPLAGGASAAVLTLLPAVFLPPGKDRVSVADQKVALGPYDQLYRPLDEFLDRFQRFEGRVDIWPRPVAGEPAVR